MVSPTVNMPLNISPSIDIHPEISFS